MTNIEEYFRKLKQDIETKQLSNEDGGSKEQIFTRYAVEQLKLKGETDIVSISYDEKAYGKQPHKINAYAISEDSSTLDLFITKYYASNKLQGIKEEDFAKLLFQIKNFYQKAVEYNYALTIAESSEIFDCANTIGNDEGFKDNLCKINVFIITNSECKLTVTENEFWYGIRVEYKIVDMYYLYQISEEANAPINIDFSKKGYKIPCIAGPSTNEIYQVYLAIIPGAVLVDLYEDYKTRLMENNVRQFLQFTGKINQGIKETIESHPGMFLAYNNGISATAKDIKVTNNGYIVSVDNLQIVNGGQTTASLYYAKILNPNIDLSHIYVQVKISVIKKDDEFDNIVSNISRCANTQNKVNEADFSANDERLLQIEKMSRYVTAPETKTQPYATYWYFERAKGQYKNFRLKDGFNHQREKQFDLKYPKSQVFTKQELAKYINAYTEIYKDGKLVIGPHIVCRGNEKCYEAFRMHNLPQPSVIDNIYFEDTVAKMILFQDADRRYGTKSTGNPIGDLKKSVVPYSIAILNRITNGKIDLYKIWRAQKISQELSDLLYDLMKQVNKYIIENARTSRYEEWCKKEECWNELKDYSWLINIEIIKNDLIDPKSKYNRKSINISEKEQIDALYNKQYIESIPSEIWNKTAIWGKESGHLTQPQIMVAKEICRKMANNIELLSNDIERGIIIADILAKYNIDLLYQSNSYAEEQLEVPAIKNISQIEVSNLITEELLEQMLAWDETRHILKSYTRKNIESIIYGDKEMSNRMKWGSRI